MNFGINLIVVQLVLYVSTTFNTQTKKLIVKEIIKCTFYVFIVAHNTIIDFLWYM